MDLVIDESASRNEDDREDNETDSTEIDNENEENENECVVCQINTPDSLVIECDFCCEWSHLSCVNLTPLESKRIIEWYCNECEQLDNLTSWRRKRATREQRIDKQKNYFDVESIENIKQRGSERFFRIKWKGYEEKTWEPERNLDGAIDILQKFLRERKLKPSEIYGLLGAPKCDKINRANWVSMSNIIATIHKAMRWLKIENPGLQISELVDKPTTNGLYFLAHRFHCYTLLYNHSKKTAFIADGMNILLEDKEVLKEVKDRLKIHLKLCTYNHQMRVDYCGSSALLIGLEMIKASKSNHQLKTIHVSKTWLRIITKQMHKYKSETIKVTKLRDRRVKLSCDRCYKSFKSTQRRAYSLHTRLCQT